MNYDFLLLVQLQLINVNSFILCLGVVQYSDKSVGNVNLVSFETPDPDLVLKHDVQLGSSASFHLRQAKPSLNEIQGAGLVL
jgi:hypothetical protein